VPSSRPLGHELSNINARFRRSEARQEAIVPRSGAWGMPGFPTWGDTLQACTARE
jgi:hypothetical protein